MNKENKKATNLLLGAIYINANTGTPCRLVNIVSCQGVWLEAFDGEGYGDLVKFEDCHHADIDEVNDYLEDYRAFHASEKAPSHKAIEPREWWHGKEVVRDSDGSAVVGWYDDENGNDIRCRD
jgi:hypothetical protein